MKSNHITYSNRYYQHRLYANNIISRVIEMLTIIDYSLFTIICCAYCFHISSCLISIKK